MHQRETRFAVNARPDELWRFIRDFESLCTCIPGVERVSLVDDKTAELTVKEKVGVVPLIVNLTARIDSEEPPRRLHATARAEHLTMSIDVSLQASGSGTELLGLINVKGKGPLKPIVDRLFERRATERAAQFADCLEKRFGAVSSANATVPSRRAPSPLRERVGPIRRWLERLRRRLLGPGRTP